MAGHFSDNTRAKANDCFCQQAFKVLANILDLIEQSFDPKP